jgi:hypothetical protein
VAHTSTDPGASAHAETDFETANAATAADDALRKFLRELAVIPAS